MPRINNSGPNLLFQKYSVRIDKDDGCYVVTKYGHDGSTSILRGDERTKVLSGEALKGAVAFTKDDQQKSWLHALLKLAQFIHEVVTGRFRKLNDGKLHKLFDPKKNYKTYSNSCHGMVIRGPAGTVNESLKEKYNGNFHPLECVDPRFEGMILAPSYDIMRDDDTGELEVYVPLEVELAQQNSDFALRSSFPLRSKEKEKDVTDPTKLKAYTPGCIADESKKVCFSVNKMLGCLFHTTKKNLAPKEDAHAMRAVAFTIANLLQTGNVADFVDEKGNARTYFCCSYVTTVLQSALYQRAIEELSTADDLASFKQNLDLKALTDKVVGILEKKSAPSEGDSPIATALWKTYNAHKIARINPDQAPSLRVMELLDKSSYTLSDKPKVEVGPEPETVNQA